MSFVKVLGKNGISSFAFADPNTIDLSGDNFIDVNFVTNEIKGDALGLGSFTFNNFRNPAGWEIGVTVITPATSGTCTLTLSSSDDDSTYTDYGSGNEFIASNEVKSADALVNRIYTEENSVLFDVTAQGNFIRLDGNNLCKFQRLNIALDSVDVIALCVTYYWGHQRKQGADIYS